MTMTFLDALILGVVEGITEFLPISSTGHLILTSALLGIPHSAFLKSFEVIIQLGAIASVLWLYGRKLVFSRELDLKLMLAFAPTAVVGLTVYPIIKTHFLGNTPLVAASLFFGGIAMLFFEKWYRPEQHLRMYAHEHLSRRDAVMVGFWQMLALVPGVSRSAATSIGAMTLGLERKSAIEFSFLLAVPTILAASLYDLIKNWEIITQSSEQFALLGVGFIAAFFSASLAIGFLLRHVERRTFREFAWYRIVLALFFFVFFV